MLSLRHHQMTPARSVGAARRLALTAACGFLAVASAVALQQQSTSGAVEVSPGLSKKSILRGIEGTAGSFEVQTKVDMAAVGAPDLAFTVTGTAESQLLFNGEGMLTRTDLEGVETLAFLGARNDSGKLFNLTLDGARTAMTYSEGDVTGEGALVLSDPFKTFRTVTMFVENGGTLTKLFVGPDWKELAETRAVRRGGAPKGVLGALLARELMAEQVNRDDKDPDPARNYAPEHARLADLVGDFKVEVGDGEASARLCQARLVGNGRFLLYVSGVVAQPEPSGAESGEAGPSTGPTLRPESVDQCTLLGFDSVRRVFQMFQVSGAEGPVHYCEGAPRKDGSLLLRDLVGGLKVKCTPGVGGGQDWEWTVGRSDPVEIRLRPVSTAQGPAR